ncbi:MAG: glycoside hydrolase family 127 protein [Pirellulales bacterium]|nr:glycoside hydrolase family 127 protein [Pirellulales bacterium]
MLKRGIERLEKAPYTVPWIMADVSFEVNRIYTNFSGDVSGRFIEIASLTSPPGEKSPPTLASVLETITRYQKPDGHFGVDVDWDQRLVADAPALTLLWGNARLLNGLIAAAERYDDARLLAAAKRLGDFYVATADKLCDPRREAEYAASGTYGHSYRCDYFPAIESLALLHETTKDEQYLIQADRMARWFWEKYDVLPNDHAHGNLCAWRGILLLYRITGDREYLERAVRKWDYAVRGGFVWPIGGTGEKWHVFFHNDEGCALSDWLRFNLELWRYTGDAKYLKMAERLLRNQYAANQSANGSFGGRFFDGDWAGPIGAKPHARFGAFHEGDACCNFHGPLGLYHLKSYLACGSKRGVFVNFPFDFTATVKASGGDWRVSVHTISSPKNDETTVEVKLKPVDIRDDARTTLWVRPPDWAKSLERIDFNGKELAPQTENGYRRVDGDFRTGGIVKVVLRTGLTMEKYRFGKIAPRSGEITRVQGASFFAGPRILAAAMPISTSGRPTVLATIDSAGNLAFPLRDADGYITVTLIDSNIAESKLAAAIESAPALVLRPWLELPREQRAVFSFDAIILPVELIPASLSARLQGTAP